MKSRCVQRTERCLSTFLSPSCFCSEWAKLCLPYLSRALVKSFGSSYLSCKNTELSLGQRMQCTTNIYRMLEKLICLFCCCCLLNVLTFQFAFKDIVSPWRLHWFTFVFNHHTDKHTQQNKVFLKTSCSQNRQLAMVTVTNDRKKKLNPPHQVQQFESS